MSNNSQADQAIDWSRDFTLGILGGGQLGKMLLDETARVDIKTAVLEPSADAPAAARANRFEVGDLKDYDTVLNFGRSVDMLTFEIEGAEPGVDTPEDLERVRALLEGNQKQHDQ